MTVIKVTFSGLLIDSFPTIFYHFGKDFGQIVFIFTLFSVYLYLYGDTNSTVSKIKSMV